MKLMKMKNIILVLVAATLVTALVQYVGEQAQVTKVAEATLNLEVVMTTCVEEAKAAWLKGTGYNPKIGYSTAVAILAAEIFKERALGR